MGRGRRRLEYGSGETGVYHPVNRSDSIRKEYTEKEKRNGVMVNVRVPIPLYKAVAEEVVKQERSISWIVRKTLTKWLEDGKP